MPTTYKAAAIRERIENGLSTRYIARIIRGLERGALPPVVEAYWSARLFGKPTTPISLEPGQGIAGLLAAAFATPLPSSQPTELADPRDVVTLTADDVRTLALTPSKTTS